MPKPNNIKPATQKPRKPPAGKPKLIVVSSPANMPGITACIVAKNEALRIEDAIKSLLGWTVQIILIDLASTPRYSGLMPCANRKLSGPPDITVRHQWPPDWRPVVHGKLVVIQPWETSHLPERDWVEGAIKNAHEVWANSRFVRDVFVRSGVPAENIHLLPHRVHTDIFTPDGPLMCARAGGRTFSQAAAFSRPANNITKAP